ncbi:MAG TPA: hypothetical protein VFM82_12340, partial [Flavobacteriaceae bacterium]|nr:hypothetical protein [Flavobacteriaceae bacterium]
KLEAVVLKNDELTQPEREVAMIHVANILGRTFEEIGAIYPMFSLPNDPERFLRIIYYLGKLAIDETLADKKRTITFSAILRERLGHHIHGEVWADAIKAVLVEKGLAERPVHIISANMHSVMNTLYAPLALEEELSKKPINKIYEDLSDSGNGNLRNRVMSLALKRGMTFLEDKSGANINVQIFDTEQLNHPEKRFSVGEEAPVLIVMDYAFGEQAYETMDELLKPYNLGGEQLFMDVRSISIMGKAGILDGKKGDIMIPTAHLFEGTADNYPFENELRKEDFAKDEVEVFEGAMISVLGTSLQNKDILRFFHDSTWNVIGLEMEGAHYQKAIQSASKLRGNISPDVKVRYAYYASDNPLETGSTLASGGLGTAGVRPTYLITNKILEQIFEDGK